MTRGPDCARHLPKGSTTSSASSRAGSTSPRPSARSCRPVRSPPAGWLRSSTRSPGCRCWRSGPAPASSPAPSCPRRRARKSLCRRVFSRIRAPSATASIPASTSSRAMPSISTRTLGDKRGMMFDCVISGVPLLNFPVARRVAYIEGLLDRIPPGRPVVQLTYGPMSPIPPGGATTRSSISTSSSATSRRRSCGSTGARSSN